MTFECDFELGDYMGTACLHFDGLIKRVLNQDKHLFS